MEITVHLNAVEGLLYEGFYNALPSLTPEQQAELGKSTGKIPLCRENFADILFVFGFKQWREREAGAKEAVSLADARIKGEALRQVLDLVQIAIDLDMEQRAILKKIERKEGKKSQGYLLQAERAKMTSILLSCLQTGKPVKQRRRKKRRNQK